MAIFEIEGPDGAIYEVDAPDEQSAIAGFQQAMGGEPDPQNADGTYGQPPEGMVFNPETGQMEDLRSPINPNIPTGRANAAALGAGQGLGFNMLDEAVAGASTLVGGDYDYNLGRMREAERRAADDHPVAYYGGTVGGAIGTGAGLASGGMSLGANAINAGWRLPGVMAASGVEGGIMGGLYGFGSGETTDERLSEAKSGAMVGGVLGAAVPAVVQGVSSVARRAVTPFRTSPERVAAAQMLRSEGVPVTAGQLTGNRSLRFSESELGGRVAANLMDDQKEAFTRAILGRAGVSANRATPEVMDDAFRAIGQQFDDLASANRLVPDAQMLSDLRVAFNDYGSMVPVSMRSPIVENLTNDIVSAVRRGPLSGSAYQNLTSRIAKAARGASNPDLRNALYGIRNSLDDAMERSIAATNPAHAGAWRAARESYRNLLAVEQAATRAGEAAAEGLISPANIRNAAVNQGRRAYARGQGDFSDLARAGSMLLSPLPDSGTAGRLRAQNLAAFGPMIGGAVIGGGAGAYQSGDMTGALTGAAIGAAAPRVAGRALMSRPVQSYLSNQVMSVAQDPLKRAIMNAILTGNTSAFAHRLPSP